jgi:hypothetical protein
MSDPLHARIDRIEAQLRRWRLFALAGLLAAATGIAVSCSRGGAGDRAPQPLVLRSPDGKQSVEVTAAGITLTADGRRTIIEGGQLLLDTASHQIAIKVGGAETPASLLMADRKQRNFNHLYVNGTAGLELAGLREYKNLSTP